MSNLIQIHMATAASAGLEQLGRARALEAQALAARASSNQPSLGDVAIRRAQAGDRAALTDLALLDGDRDVREALLVAADHGDVLVAEVDGELRAALALDGERVVADPFAPSAAVAGLLHVRARQIGASLDMRPRRFARAARRAA